MPDRWYTLRNEADQVIATFRLADVVAATRNVRDNGAPCLQVLFSCGQWCSWPCDTAEAAGQAAQDIREKAG